MSQIALAFCILSEGAATPAKYNENKKPLPSRKAASLHSSVQSGQTEVCWSVVPGRYGTPRCESIPDVYAIDSHVKNKSAAPVGLKRSLLSCYCSYGCQYSTRLYKSSFHAVELPESALLTRKG
eukprot:scaffold538_cov166-Amphora_coffeaeformis.AAC.21